MTTPPPTDPLIGTTVSQYEIVAKLGGGGMGVVYKARDTKLGRSVALKFLPPQWSHDEGAKQRFVREAQAASATNHRNICVIHNIEETADGRLFIVMAYYEGETLKQKLERGPLPIIEAIEIASEIADGLAKAHAQGVVHRDVKPGNLIVTEDGVKILDFGLAKFADALQLTVPGSTIGTVGYMSPEQARGEEADARSDVWALGIVMFEMLTGSVPFRGTYQEATFHAIKNEPLPSLRAARPDIPEALERIVLKALEKDPSKRFQNAREPARDLKLLAGRTVPVDLLTIEVPRPAGVGSDSLPKRSSPRRIVTPTRVIIALALLLAVGIGGYVWTHRPIERLPVAVVPLANHTGNTELDPYRLALTSALIDEISESPNIRVVPYLRLLEMIRPFASASGDVSSNDAIRAIATASGALFLVVPTLEYRDSDTTWILRTQIRNAQTGTTLATYETAPVTSTLPAQTAFRLSVAAADTVQQHFKSNGPGRSFQPRPMLTRFHDPGAARSFVDGINKYDELEYSAALPALSNAVTLDDQHALSHAWLSRVYLILSRKNDAIGAAQRAKALVTSETPKSDAAFIGAVVAESQGDLDAADASYRALISAESDDPWARAEFADFLKRRQNRNQPAIDAYHALLRLEPSYIRPHVDLCQLYTRIDDHSRAEQEARLAIDRYRALGIKSGEAQALLCLGESQREQGGTHLAEARRNVDAARSLIEVLDEPYNLSRAIFYQASIDYSDGNLHSAARLFEEAAKRTHDVGNRISEGLALMNQAVLNQLLGHPTAAVDLYQRSRGVFLLVGNERRVAEVDADAAALEIDYGSHPDEALKRLANAKGNFEKLGYVDFQLVAMLSEADSNRYTGRLEKARTLLQSARAIAKEKQLTGKITEVTVSLALTELQAGNYATALGLLQGLFDDQGNGEEGARVALATVQMRLGDFRNAKLELDRALSAIESRQLTGLLPLVHNALGQIGYQTGDTATARAHFTTAISSWTDPLANVASIEARCFRGLLEDSPRDRGSRNDLEVGVQEAARSRRLALEALCRTHLARLDVRTRRFSEALATLKDLPADTPDATIGPELRAKAEYWRAVASGLGQTKSEFQSGDGRGQLLNFQKTLPEEFRDSFGLRLDIAEILRPPTVQSHP